MVSRIYWEDVLEKLLVMQANYLQANMALNASEKDRDQYAGRYAALEDLKRHFTNKQWN